MLQREVGILLDERVSYFESHDNEYPEDSKPMRGLSPAEQLMERARLRRLAALRRRPRKPPVAP
ncbi:MAG: hypothetical protein ACFCVA_13020 [Gammaproteobacteria bacterium]